jgi:spermidine synthase
LRARKLNTRYVRDWAIPFRMAPDRVRDLASKIRPEPGTPLNRDFAPIAYYFDTTLWATEFNRGYRTIFQSLAGVPFSAIAAALALALLAAVALVRRCAAERPRLRATAAFCAGSMGFAMMGLEMLLLLGFQAVHGYVYHELAMLTAAFMAGMAFGAWRGVRSRAGLRGLAGMQIVAAFSPFLLCVPFDSRLFPVLAAAGGAIGGYQFAVASRLYFAGPEDRGRSLGALYAIDLAGACLGALAISTYLVPVFGFLRTAVAISLVCLAPAIAARGKE